MGEAKDIRNMDQLLRYGHGLWYEQLILSYQYILFDVHLAEEHTCTGIQISRCDASETGQERHQKVPLSIDLT